MKNITGTIKKHGFTLSIVLLFAVFVWFKLIFVYFGYISTEEGTIIYNQQLAYSGYLPFINYDAWNSFLNDYLIGWQSFISTPSILNQRFLGLALSCFLFLLTLKLTKNFQSQRLTLLTAGFLTFGSYTFVYLSTIPYSELTMSILLVSGLIYLSESLLSGKISLRSHAGVIILIASIFVKIQALPAVVIILGYLVRKQFALRKNISPIIFTIILTVLVICLPFIILSYDNFVYALTWPFKADQILIYQKNSISLNISSFFSFIQDIFRDYQIFIIIFPATLYTLWQKRTNLKDKPRQILLLLYILMAATFIITGLIHKPPFASYLYPGIPLFSIVAAYGVENLLTKIIDKTQRRFLYLIIIMILIGNFFSFQHFKLIKIRADSLYQTPHEYLSQISSYIASLSNPQDEVLSFYTPITVSASRKVPDNFNRDRFSMSMLSDDNASKYHLMNSNLIKKYIIQKKAKIIIFSDSDIQYFGENESQQQRVLQTIKENYSLSGDNDNLKYIEQLKARPLYIYIRN